MTVVPAIVRTWTFTAVVACLALVSNLMYLGTEDLSATNVTGFGLLLVMFVASDWWAVLFTL